MALVDLAKDEGLVTYSVSMPDIDFPAKQITLRRGKAVRVSLERKGIGHFQISVVVRGIYDEAAATAAAAELLETLLARISVHLNTRVFEATFHGATVPLPPDQQTGTARYHVQALATIPVDTPVSPPRALADVDWTGVASTLGAPDQPADLIRAVYRLGAAQHDSLASFMLLYNVLLQLCDDRQTAVDELIRSVRPGVPVSPSPLKPGMTETFYTRLRNEVAHPREGISLAKTSAEIRNIVREFRELVRQAVLTRLRA